MKIRINTNVVCLDCEEEEVEHHAHGLCYNCYMRKYQQKARKKRSEAVDNSRLTR